MVSGLREMLLICFALLLVDAAEDDQGKVLLFLRDMGGAFDALIDISVPSDCAVGDVRQMAAQRCGIEDYPQLEFGGERLIDDAAFIADVGLGQEAVIQVCRDERAAFIRLLTEACAGEESRPYNADEVHRMFAGLRGAQYNNSRCARPMIAKSDTRRSCNVL